MGTSWKTFEARSAALFGEKRCWANSGGRYDFPHEADIHAVFGQCKNVKNMSMNKLSELAGEIALMADTHGPGSKIGVVCVKTRKGRGKETAPIVAMTFAQFEKLVANTDIMEAIRKRKRGEVVA